MNSCQANSACLAMIDVHRIVDFSFRSFFSYVCIIHIDHLIDFLIESHLPLGYLRIQDRKIKTFNKHLVFLSIRNDLNLIDNRYNQ